MRQAQKGADAIRAALEAPSARGDNAELLAIIRHNESVDENGDPVGAKPETKWEEGYAAGIRCLYRFLAKTQYVKVSPDIEGANATHNDEPPCSKRG